MISPDIVALWALGAVQQHYLLNAAIELGARDYSRPVTAIIVALWPLVALYVVVCALFGIEDDDDYFDDEDDDIDPDDDDLLPAGGGEQ